MEDTSVQLKNNKNDGQPVRRTTGGTDCLQAAKISKCRASIFSEDPQLQLDGTKKLVQLLCVEKSRPIQEVIDSGAIPRLVEFLKRDESTDLQFAAACALANAITGTSNQTNVVVKAGAVPLFIQLLASPSEDVKEQSAWALGNIAADSLRLREMILGLGALHPLLLISESTRTSTVRCAVWTLSNLCLENLSLTSEFVEPTLPVLRRLLESTDTETAADACWVISFLCDGPNDRIQAVIDAGVVPTLVQLLAHQQVTIQTPALRAIGHLVAGGTEIQTQMVIDSNALPALLHMLESPDTSIRKEACWTLSNITAGSPPQIQAVINVGVFPKLIELLQEEEFEVQKEAALAVSNAACGGAPEQILFLAQQGVIAPLCGLLHSRLVCVALAGLETILRAASNAGDHILTRVVASFIDCGGDSSLEELQAHQNRAVFSKAVMILRKYFSSVNEADDTDDGEDEW